MFQEMSAEEWIPLAKKEFIKQGVPLPEEEELWELAHMECMNEEKSIEEYTTEQK